MYQSRFPVKTLFTTTFFPSNERKLIDTKGEMKNKSPASFTIYQTAFIHASMKIKQPNSECRHRNVDDFASTGVLPLKNDVSLYLMRWQNKTKLGDIAAKNALIRDIFFRKTTTHNNRYNSAVSSIDSREPETFA